MTILLIGLALIFGCSEDEEQRLYRLAPDLGRDVAQRLVAHDDAAFADYSREAGIKEMIDARLALRRGLSFGAAASYTESAAYLMPYIGRVSERLSADYGCHDYLHDYDFWMSLPHDQAAELGCLESEMNDTYLDPDLLLVEKIPRLQRYASAFRTAGYWMGVAVAEYATAEFMSSLGRDEERMQHLRAALALARREGLTIMTCQILGVVGKIHRSAGRIDSMAICWNEALGIASEHRLPEHAANINSLYANHYADAGRLALAADLHHAAMQVCREYKGGYLELPFIIEAMYFHAELGFWEVVRHLLQRARVLNREYARSPRILQRKVNAVRLDEMEARYLCAQGKTQEAEEIFCRLEEEIRGLPFRIDYVRLLHARSQGLLASGRTSEALPVIGKGIVRAIGASLPGTRARFSALLAQALWQLGNTEAAMQSLRDFEDLALELGAAGDWPLRREWTAHDAIQARLLQARGDHAGAVATLRRGLDRLRGYLAGTEASAPGYIFLDACDDLRLAMHVVVGDDPVAGYGLEMGWRRLYEALGMERRSGVGHVAAVWAKGSSAGMHASVHTAALDDLLRSHLPGGGDASQRGAGFPEAFLRQLQERGAIHCVYFSTPTEILRWTAAEGSVRRDTLSVPVAEMRRLISRALELMSEDPGDLNAPPQPELRGVLSRLAQVLLPPEILYCAADPERRLVLITPDSFLGLLPFEAFDLSHGRSYAPLLEQCDVAYLRLADQRPEPPALGPGVVLADPQLDRNLRRQYPSLGRLGQGMAEAEMVAGTFAGSRILRRDAATKRKLFELWEQAPFIYAAAHFIRDPEAPFLTFIPMSRPVGTYLLDASYLSIDDIRSADLRQCRLVVLSGCASGSPYVSAEGSAPGLGDAFLDAGAGAVIQTFWPVRDGEARDLMRDFVRAWGQEPDAPIESLCKARRSSLQGPAGPRHPFTWAAYAIKLGRL